MCRRMPAGNDRRTRYQVRWFAGKEKPGAATYMKKPWASVPTGFQNQTPGFARHCNSEWASIRYFLLSLAPVARGGLALVVDPGIRQIRDLGNGEQFIATKARG